VGWIDGTDMLWPKNKKIKRKKKVKGFQSGARQKERHGEKV